ncbi:PPE family protein [Mycobacterium sp. 050134]|uniref:PPE family protein n=1 Tax=Mycobacterium sp. 050134 TaxID=3096111 RepID=UPI002ED7FF76
MDYATLPPEINSSLMYAGPGAAPMLAAAAAWESLAADLYGTASSYQSAVAGLTAGPWLGPSSMIMAAAASSYTAWISDTAARAEETAGQAKAAAAAYETAFAATVPPTEVAANRSLLAALVATNLLGQNTAAIAATEALYGEMWAQDAAAMYGYAGSAAAATQLTPFSPPRQNTDGVGAQADVVAQAAELPGGSAQGLLSVLTQPILSAAQALTSATSPLGVQSPLDLVSLGADGIAYGFDAPMSPLGAISLPIDLIGAQTGLHTDDIVSGWEALGALPGEVTTTTPVTAAASEAASSTVSADVGSADAIGALSVPPSWTAAAPAVRSIALALPAAPAGLGAQTVSATLGNTFGEMALAGTAARALRDSIGVRGPDPRDKEAARCPAPAGGDAEPAGDGAEPKDPGRTVVMGLAAEVREFAKLRDEGLITHEQFIEHRDRLLG